MFVGISVGGRAVTREYEGGGCWGGCWEENGEVTAGCVVPAADGAAPVALGSETAEEGVEGNVGDAVALQEALFCGRRKEEAMVADGDASGIGIRGAEAPPGAAAEGSTCSLK